MTENFVHFSGRFFLFVYLCGVPFPFSSPLLSTFKNRFLSLEEKRGKREMGESTNQLAAELHCTAVPSQSVSQPRGNGDE